MGKVDTILSELKLDAQVSQVTVDTIEKAKGLKFLGSPSVRVNGKDIEPGAEERDDYGMQ